MKKRILLLYLALLLIAAGCTEPPAGAGRRNSQPNTVQDIISAAMADAGRQNSTGSAESSSERQSGLNTSAPTPEPIDESATVSGAEGVDIDLTVLSSTMVYSEVYNIVAYPEQYIGKIIKMNGLCADYHDEATDQYYYACIIQDATACCAQGIEFVLTTDYACPGDYPLRGDEITVIGVFDTYMEGDAMYCTLRDAVLE